MDNLKWLEPLRDNPEYQESFNKWVEEALQIYAQKALLNAKDMDQLLGLRYAAGELLALKGLVNYNEEEERVNDVSDGHVGA